MLNPFYRDYEESANADITADLHLVLEKYGKLGLIDPAAAIIELSGNYRKRIGIAGSSLATSAEKTMSGCDWWDAIGCEMPNIQKLAKIVLVQPISATMCEKLVNLRPHFDQKAK